MKFNTLIPWLVGAIVLLVDILSKLWVDQNLPTMGWQYATYPHGGIAVFQNFLGIDFSIVHTINHGAAWGVLSSWQDVLLYVRIGVIILIMAYMIWFNRDANAQTPLALILAGATGNVIDYFVYGHVVDMFYFVFWGYEYPVFNVADSAIFIGIVWLLIKGNK